MADLDLNVDLNAAIQQYAVALECLTPPPTANPAQHPEAAAPEAVAALPHPSEAQVLAVLIARDRVQAALAAQITASHPPADLSTSLSQIPPLEPSKPKPPASPPTPKPPIGAPALIPIPTPGGGFWKRPKESGAIASIGSGAPPPSPLSPFPSA
jgi:hypothetical protein